VRFSERDLERIQAQPGYGIAGGAVMPPEPGAKKSRATTASPAWAELLVGDRRMNKLEAAYAQVLELRVRAREICWWQFEAFKLRLAYTTFYTPDFAVIGIGGELEFHETKGFWRDDARVKIKTAAAKFPFRFIEVTRARKREGGGWRTREVKR
jgi:hypothetical protein